MDFFPSLVVERVFQKLRSRELTRNLMYFFPHFFLEGVFYQPLLSELIRLMYCPFFEGGPPYGP